MRRLCPSPWSTSSSCSPGRGPLHLLLESCPVRRICLRGLYMGYKPRLARSNTFTSTTIVFLFLVLFYIYYGFTAEPLPVKACFGNCSASPCASTAHEVPDLAAAGHGRGFDRPCSCGASLSEAGGTPQQQRFASSSPCGHVATESRLVVSGMLSVLCQRCGMELYVSDQSGSYSSYAAGWGGAPSQPSRGWDQQRPSAPNTWNRRTPSLRRRSRPRKQGQRPTDPTSGASGPKGQSKGAEWQVANWQPPAMPWPQDSARAPALPSPLPDNGKAEILAALKAAFAASGQAPPASVMELMGKMEAVEGKALTKQLHTTAKQLGEAKQVLCKVRQARQAHQVSWQHFMLKTAAAIEAGQEQFDKRLLEYDQQENEAKEKVASARRALREVSSKAK